MKPNRLLALALALLLAAAPACAAGAADAPGAVSIVLSDSGVTVDGKAASTDPGAAVYVGAEIVYYHDGTDASYGQGTASEKHSAQEAAAHTVVTVTQPGTYRLTGTLSRGQIAIDLGKNAKYDPDAVVTLILDNADVTCTVAPALIFYNVYECDQAFLAYDDGNDPDYQPTPTVDTSAAGANVILAAGSVNNFIGSHVARIYKEGSTKKLHKYDGAFYSKMSMNISGERTPGSDVDDTGRLNIVADNEGLDSELHLTINSGSITIVSQDDGINTNEDFYSVTTVNGGSLRIDAGNGSEGDGIDSNGYLVINGGSIWSTAHPASDGGIDADSPILINGGTLSAFGGRNDAADKASAQPYMELAFASTLPVGSVIELKDEADDLLWSATTLRACQSITLTTPALELNTPYRLYVDGVLQCWNGNSFGMGFGGGMMGGQWPDSMTPPDGDRPTDGMVPPDGDRPTDGMAPPDGNRPTDGMAPPDGDRPTDGMAPPDAPSGDFPGFDPARSQEGFDRGNRQDFFDREGFDPGQFDRDDRFGGGWGGFGATQVDGSGSTDFTLTDTVRSFSGVCDSDTSGKARVSFAVEGVLRVGRNTLLPSVTAITPSVTGLDPALIQVSVADAPSEDYFASCLLSEGLDAVNALLPIVNGDYTLTVAVAAGNDAYTGATQLNFNVGALPFTDISEADPGYAAVKALYDAGATNGTGDGRFSPDATLSRAEAITILARLSNVDPAPAGVFDDVDPASWYGGYVTWAVEQGLVQGDGQGHFYPDMKLTCDQLDLILSRWDAGYQPTDRTGPITRVQLAQTLADFLHMI